jgi:de-etiolated-1
MESICALLRQYDRRIDIHVLKPQVSRNADHHPAFVAVYNMATTEIVSFYQVNLFFILCFIFMGFLYYSVFTFFSPWSVFTFCQNSADELYMLFEQFGDHFHVTSRNSMYMNFVSSHSNNIHALEQLRSIKDKASNSSQVKYCW